MSTGPIERLVRPVPDWPEPGVTFRDITPLLGDHAAFEAVLDDLVEKVAAFGDVGAVLGVEARGFIIGAPLALRLGVGFVPVRKEGKLPAATLSAAYALEYGEATIEVHVDALEPGTRVLLVDDVLATGGTLGATVELAERAGAEVAGAAVLIEIAALGGRARLGTLPLVCLHTY